MADTKGVTVANAFVQLMPSMKGAEQSISDSLTGATDKAVSQSSSKLAGFGKALVAALAVDKIADAVKTSVSTVVNTFSDYQQYTGGIEKLFGDASGKVETYASQAFQTAGMSANEYMNNVTGIAAKLITDMGGDTSAAADVANQAMVDMSDNANIFGTDMNSIELAYQDFAKGNYGLLDNLKLGYGGSQAEMARLINDSGVLGDSIEVTAETVKDVPFDKVIEAIHQIQVNEGIAGDTAAEASDTVQGSLTQLKGAWTNLMAGLGDGDADIDEQLSEVTDSAKTYLDNVIPVISNFAGTVIAYLPQAWASVREIAKEGAKDTLYGIQGILSAHGITIPTPDTSPFLASLEHLQKRMSVSIALLEDSLRPAVTAIRDAFSEVAGAILPTSDEVSSAGLKMTGALTDFSTYINSTVAPAINDAMPSITSAIGGAADFVVGALPKVSEAFGSARDALGTAKDFVTGTAAPAIESAFGQVRDVAGDAMGTVRDKVSEAMQSDQFQSGAAALKSAMSGVKSVATDLGKSALSKLADYADKAQRAFDALAGSSLLTSFGDMVRSAFGGAQEVMGSFADLWETRSESISSGIDALIDHASGIGDGIGGVLGTVSDVIGEVADGASGLMGALQPVADFLGGVFTDAMGMVGDAIQGLLDGFNSVTQSEGFQSAISGISDSMTNLGDKVSGFTSGVLEPLWNDVLAPLGDFLASTVAPVVGEVLAGAVQLAVTAFNGLLDALGWVLDKVTPLGDSISDFCDGVSQKFDDWGVADKVQSIWSSIQSFIEDPIGTLKDTVGGFVDDVKSRFDSWGISDVVGGAWDAINSSVGGVVSTLSSSVGGFVGNVSSAFQSWGIDGVVQGIWSNLQSFISDPIGTLSSGVAGFVGNVSSAFSSWGIDGTVSTIWSSIQSFIQDPIGTLSGGIAGFVSDVQGKFSSWGIDASVDSVWQAIQGFIQDPIGTLTDSISGFVTDVWGWMRFDGLSDTVSGAFGSARDGANNAVQGIVDFVQGIPDQITGFFSGIGDRISDAFGNIHFPSPHVDWSSVNVFGQDISYPTISFYATGGFIDKPTAIVGEAGGEFVWPSYQPYLSRYASALASEMEDHGGQQVSQTFNITSDDPGYVAAVVARRQRRAYA